MRRPLMILGACVLAFAACLAVAAFTYEPKIRPRVMAGPVPIGGLTRPEAEFRLRTWWEGAKLAPISLNSEHLTEPIPARTPGKWGVALDDRATVASAPMDGFGAMIGRLVGSGGAQKVVIDLRYNSIPIDFADVDQFVRLHTNPTQPARVRVGDDGAFQISPEQPGFVVHRDQIQAAVIASLQSGEPAKAPIDLATKSVPDAALSEIKDVVAEFTTRFPASQRDRNTNIRVAAGKIDGYVLMPGAKMSFNDVVGQRTVANGFKLAGVYRNGKHDIDIGGGICQVSTTMYNAALLSGLSILRRQNHSMPVAYVPIGRDASVSFGTLDLVIQNTAKTPIAICASVGKGSLTFKVLGQKDPDLSYRIETEGHETWDTGVKVIPDTSVPVGADKIVEKGSAGHKVRSYRVTLKNGQKIARSGLGTSYYKGGVRIIARNPDSISTGQPELANPTTGSAKPLPSGKPADGSATSIR